MNGERKLGRRGSFQRAAVSGWGLGIGKGNWQQMDLKAEEQDDVY